MDDGANAIAIVLKKKEKNVENDDDKKSKEKAQTKDLSEEMDAETTPNFMCAPVVGYNSAPTLLKETINEGATAVASALRVNSTISTIYLEDDKFIDKGAKEVASALRVNHTLKYSEWETGNIPVACNDYRRSRTVIDVLKGVEIANIIFASNKERSIHAVYDGATVKCKTSSFLKFAVKLLLPAQNAEYVMVDVRRVSGCAMAFRDEYQALQAVLDINTASSFQQISLPAFDFMKDNYIPLEEGIIKRSIEKSVKNLESKMYDTRIITLQDLLLTTDPDSKETSSTACKLIVENYSKILEYVVTDMMKGNKSADNDDDSQEYMRSLSLNLLNNLLITESDNDILHEKAKEHQWTHTLIKSLVLYVRQARDHPWNACLASKCLCSLASTYNMYKDNNEVCSALESAEQVGRISHMQLEKEAQTALHELGISSYREERA